MSDICFLNVSREPDYSNLKLGEIAITNTKTTPVYTLISDGDQVCFQVNDLCCLETIHDEKKNSISIILADILAKSAKSTKSTLKYLYKIEQHIDNLIHKEQQHVSLGVKHDNLYDDIICLNKADDCITIFKTKNSRYHVNFRNQISFEEIHNSNLLYKKNFAVLLKPIIYAIDENKYEIHWSIQQIKIDRTNL